MIFEIAKQEFRNLLREGRFRTAAILLCVLFALSLFGAYDYYTALKKQHKEAAATARNHWENQGDKNPHSAAHYGTYVFKPAQPLSFFDRGVDAFTGNTLFLEAHRMNEAQNRAAADRSEFARLGSLTPSFVLGILFPLFIVVLGFGSMAGERENGNLRLLQAQGVRPTALFFGKSFGLWYAILLLALPFLVLGSAGLWQSGGTSEHWLRYGWLALAYLLYLGCFIHLTLLISAISKKRSVALVGGLGIWVFICLLAPKATVNMAQCLHPTPSWQSYQDAVKQDLENGVDGHDPYDTFTKKLEEETLQKHGVSTVDSLPFNWSGFIMQKGEEHETVVFQKHKDRLLDIYQNQQRVQQTAAILSPWLLVGISSQRLAGTDIGSYHNFLAAAERYRIELVGELNQDLTDNFKYGDWSGTRGKAFFAKNASFEYQSPDLPEVLAGVSPALITLLLWWVLSGVLGILFFHKIKPV